MGTTSEKLTYLNTTKTLIKEELNLGGANITNEPFRAYKDKLEGIYKDFLANGTDVVWNNWLPKINGTGESITLNNTIEAKMDFVYKGNTSQNGTPTPDTPIPVQVVSGDNTIKVAGKNLFDISTITLNKTIDLANGNVNVDASNRNTSDFILVTNSVTYSCNVSMTRIAFYDENKTFISSSAVTTSIVTPNNCNYVRFSYDNSLSNIQFERGYSSSFTPYATSYPISLGNIELCKIEDYQDRIYKDNGKWYLNKQIGKVVLDGSEDWNYASVSQGSLFRNSTIITNGTTDKNYAPYSNYYVGITENNYQNRQNNQIYIQSTSNFLDIIDNRYTSTTDFKTWLSTHNTTVYYVLATPTITEITDTTLISQLEAIKKSYNEQTNISQTNDDKPFILDVVALGELT